MVWNVSDLNPNAKSFKFLVSPGRTADHRHGEKRMNTSGYGYGVPQRQNVPHMPVAGRPSKKDAAAAARRRRHSVDALDFTGLKMVDVATFLRHIRLHKYTDVLQAADISFAQMLNMTDAELEAAGVRAKGARTRLLKANERYNEFLATSSQDYHGPTSLEAIIPMGALDDGPRNRCRRNSAPTLVSYPHGRVAAEKNEVRIGSSALGAIDESNNADSEKDDDLAILVSSAASQLLSIIDEDAMGQLQDDDASLFSRSVPGDYTSLSCRSRGSNAAVNTKGFDMWASGSPYQTIWGLESSVGVL